MSSLPRYYVSLQPAPPAGFIQCDITRRVLTGGLIALHGDNLDQVEPVIEQGGGQIHGVILLPGSALSIKQRMTLLWEVHYPTALEQEIQTLADALLTLIEQLFQQIDQNRESAFYGQRISREVETIRSDYNHVTNTLLQQVNELQSAQVALQEVNEALEARVDERTRELTRANEELHRAITQLAQVEKLASLARLVAGISHELNTPLGNIVTVGSTLESSVTQLKNTLTSNSPLKRSQLMEALSTLSNGLGMISHNAERGAALIQHFKQIATDQTSMRLREFELGALLNEILITLAHQLKPTPYRVITRIDEYLLLNSYPGAVEQIITLLINNSLQHGFAQREQGTITLQAGLYQTGWIEFIYQDDGVGMDEETLKHAFEPFYTSCLGQGGSGLGLAILHNLVTGPLAGSIELHSQPDQGASFKLLLPLDPTQVTSAKAR
ncbi:sensor histidine kinase [Nitrincola sp. MINF-07-Sa-05]|uniref:sensor histidine kinase n=1 Tax=Nitrincola salilacus TaxID=3400273 RepID=UPI003917B73E